MVNFKPFFTFLATMLTVADSWYAQDGRIFNDNGEEARLKGSSWYGWETVDKVANGLWSHPMDFYVKLLDSIDVNIIRVPVCSELVLYRPNDYPFSGMIAGAPEMKGKTSMETLDMFFDQTEELGVGVMLDLHRLNDQYISELWYDPNNNKFTSETFLKTWFTLLDRYKDRSNLIAIDLLNEPHGRATWGTNDPSTDWRLFAEDAIAKIHARYPDKTWLIFVEGIDWGKNLEKVAQSPIRAPNAQVQKRIVYSPHNYGKSVVTNLDIHDTEALHRDWNQKFGYLRDKGYTLIAGEWGGQTDIDADWMNEWSKYMISKGMRNNFLWALNPSSSDVKGLLTDDWTNLDTFKVELMHRIQPYPVLPIIHKNGTRHLRTHI